MANNKFRGLGIALITPFCKDGSIDFASLDRLVDDRLPVIAQHLFLIHLDKIAVRGGFADAESRRDRPNRRRFLLLSVVRTDKIADLFHQLRVFFPHHVLLYVTVPVFGFPFLFYRGHLVRDSYYTHPR